MITIAIKNMFVCKCEVPLDWKQIRGPAIVDENWLQGLKLAATLSRYL